MNARPRVVMSIEESTRYSVTAPEADLEWFWTSTLDDKHHIRVGPNHRMGIISLFHQQHCLGKLRIALAQESVPGGYIRNHCEHCLSFMREHILCAADITLESGDAFARNFTAERVTGERECMDVEAFYENMSEQWDRWVEARQQVLVG